ncbi:ABC transporter [Fischerella thermalis CCMEE 5273]|nr:ABC transporter [Fischerella thermalis CCMEE 5273]
MHTGVEQADYAVQLEHVSKIYPGKKEAALNKVSLGFPKGRFSAIMGPSGSGKSTLIHCAAGLDIPTSGRVRLGDVEIGTMKEPQRTKLRRKKVGFVFQSFNLIPSLTVWQNILLPQRLAGVRPDRKWALDVIQRLGLKGREKSYPTELSGGQQQRVALARALAASPEVIFGDEPTGALDLRTGVEVMRLLRDAVNSFKRTVIMVTHDPNAAAWADQVIFLADGKLAGELVSPSVEQVSQRMMELNKI